MLTKYNAGCRAKVTQLVNFPASGRVGVIKGSRELVASPWVANKNGVIEIDLPPD